MPSLVVLFVVAIAAPARAALLPFRGEIDIAFGGSLLFVTVAGTGIAEVNGAGSGGPLTQLALPAGVFATSTEFPGAPPLGGLLVAAHNGAGTFANLTAHGGGGTMPILGLARLCLLAGCDTATVALDLPLSVVGAGGIAQVAGPFSVTLEGAPWTKGSVTISRPGAQTVVGGFAHGPLLMSGSTAQLGGVIALVTPVRIASTLPGFADLDSWAFLQIEFVPEPSTGLLLGAGLLAIARAARRRSERVA